MMFILLVIFFWTCNSWSTSFLRYGLLLDLPITRLSRIEKDYSLVLPAGLPVSEMLKIKYKVKTWLPFLFLFNLLFLLFHPVRVYFLFLPRGPLTNYPHLCLTTVASAPALLQTPAAPVTTNSKERIWLMYWVREGNGTLLQYSCLENPMDRGDW